jgi:hypothetical protein
MTTYKNLYNIESLNAQGSRKSWAPYVQTDSPDYSTNGLRFATEEECISYLKDLKSRWFLVRNFAPCVSDDEVNYAWIDGKAQKVGV